MIYNESHKLTCLFYLLCKVKTYYEVTIVKEMKLFHLLTFNKVTSYYFTRTY